MHFGNVMIRTCVLALMLAVCGMARAQVYPDKPIQFIASTTPGPMGDVVARVVANAMSKVMNQTILVINKPGAEQLVGLEYIAKSAPADGYTVGVIGIDGQALMPLVWKSLRFDPFKDLTLVAGLGEARYVLATPATAAPTSFRQVVEAARAAPGKLNYGASTAQVRLYTLALTQQLGVDLVHVPFSSGAPFLNALVSGQVDWGIIAEGTAASVKSRVRIHAITGSGRSNANPDIPTFAELGFPQIYGPAYALGVRSGTPQAIINRLSTAAAAALASQEMKTGAQNILFVANHDSQEAITKSLNDRFRFYQELSKRAGLQPE